jgi:hypothetical protein
MNTLPISSKLLKALALAALLATFACAADEDADQKEPVWREPVVVRQGENEHKLLTDEEAEAHRKKQREKAASEVKIEPDPGWIGDCYYYADGAYYHKDGVYWRPDMKTHYVYDEGCWHLANGGILTDTGVYFPVVEAPDGILGLPLRLAAVSVALIAGPPQDPGAPPERPVRVITEVRPSSGR